MKKIRNYALITLFAGLTSTDGSYAMFLFNLASGKTQKEELKTEDERIKELYEDFAEIVERDKKEYAENVEKDKDYAKKVKKILTFTCQDYKESSAITEDILLSTRKSIEEKGHIKRNIEKNKIHDENAKLFFHKATVFYGVIRNVLGYNKNLNNIMDKRFLKPSQKNAIFAFLGDLYQARKDGILKHNDFAIAMNKLRGIKNPVTKEALARYITIKEEEGKDIYTFNLKTLSEENQKNMYDLVQQHKISGNDSMRKIQYVRMIAVDSENESLEALVLSRTNALSCRKHAVSCYEQISNKKNGWFF